MPNIEIVSLIFKSEDYLWSIASELKSDFCKVPGWDVGIRIIANDATDEIISTLPLINVPYSIFENPDRTEYYINRTYRAYNFAATSSEYDNICFVNSDMFFTKDWLTNLLKYHNGVNIPCPRLVESGKFAPGPHIVIKDFGRSPQEFNRWKWEQYSIEIGSPQIHECGTYMPSVFSKQRFIESGMFPVGNIYDNGVGTCNGCVLRSGDEFFFHEILELKWGMRHLTVFDSLVYHITMGEGDLHD